MAVHDRSESDAAGRTGRKPLNGEIVGSVLAVPCFNAVQSRRRESGRVDETMIVTLGERHDVLKQSVNDDISTRCSSMKGYK